MCYNVFHSIHKPLIKIQVSNSFKGVLVGDKFIGAKKSNLPRTEIQVKQKKRYVGFWIFQNS